MIFGKDIQKICLYCVHARDYSGSSVLCEYKGPVSDTHKCRRFCYDPLRRTPSPPVKPKLNVKEEDFKL